MELAEDSPLVSDAQQISFLVCDELERIDSSSNYSPILTECPALSVRRLAIPKLPVAVRSLPLAHLSPLRALSLQSQKRMWIWKMLCRES
jgi:hypothetical protein